VGKYLALQRYFQGAGRFSRNFASTGKSRHITAKYCPIYSDILIHGEFSQNKNLNSVLNYLIFEKIRIVRANKQSDSFYLNKPGIAGLSSKNLKKISLMLSQ